MKSRDVRSRVRYVEETNPGAFADLIARTLVARAGTRVWTGHAGSEAPPEGAVLHREPRVIAGVSGSHHLLIRGAAESEEIALGPGDLAIFPPLAWNQPLWREPFEFYSVVFFRDYLRLVRGRWNGRPQNPPVNHYYHSPQPVRGLVGLLMEAMLVAVSGSEPALARATTEALLQALLQYCRQPPQLRHKRGRYIWQALHSYLMEHLSEPITLSVLGDRFGLHPNHVCRIFRREGGESFVDQLTRLRLERATQLLETSPLTVEEISNVTGFSDVGYFRKVFRRRMHCAPSELRQRRAGANVKIIP